MKDHIIIDGNAVYEIDDDCKNKIQATSTHQDTDVILQLLMILLML